MMDKIQMTRGVYEQICKTVGSLPPECGGVLGAGDEGVVRYYHFDDKGAGTAASYAPDIASINEMLANEWMPQGILMVGIVHSHSNGVNVPSCGDVCYGIRILQALDTVDRFYLPIVTIIDGQMHMDCYVVCRDEQHGFACRMIEWEIIDEQKNT